MKKGFILFTLLAAIFLFIVIYFNTETAAKTNLNILSTENILLSGDSLFKTGDIIFRDGRGVISAAFRKFSLKNPMFSHSGIIHIENGKIYVYHIIGGESNPSGKIRKEILYSFINPLQASSVAVYRFDVNPEVIDSIAGKYFLQNITFDTRFNLSSNDKMYCTEFVYKVISKASDQDNFLPLTRVKELTYVACDNIYLSPHAKLIYSFNYTN